MSDRLCRWCDDRGCSRCWPTFSPNKVHAVCGFRWGQHEADGHGDHTCPKPVQQALREVPCPRRDPHPPHDAHSTPGNPGSRLGPNVLCPGLPGPTPKDTTA